jgi:hypothetical protein
MASSKNRSVSPQKPNFVSHRSHCSVCAHPQCEEIEREFISWRSPADIAREFKLRDRSAIYRHAHALDLGSKRDRNIRAALARIIEKVDGVQATAGAVIQAIALYARINARGELVERDDEAGTHELFAKMNPAELEAYAKNGTLPRWFPRSKSTKGSSGSGDDENA